MLKNLDGKGDLDGKGFDKATLKAMVDAYRKSPGYVKDKSFRYAHFNAYRIIQLLVANGVLDENTPIKDQARNIQEYGVKIYLGNHVSPDTLPHGSEKYMGFTTAILCNTIIKNGYADMLGELNKVSVGENASGSDVDPGDGLDQAEVAPPYHAAPDDEEYDLGFPA